MNKEIRDITTPILRFKFTDRNSFQNWKEIKLKSIAKIISNKNVNGKISRVLTNSAADGVVDQRDFFEKDIANKNNLNGYYIVELGDYIYNPRVSNIAPAGPISKNKIGKGLMSPIYTVFRFDNVDNEFYEQYFKTSHWYKYLRSVSNTGARFDRMSITPAIFMEMPVPFPQPVEQQKIASCLSSLDDLVAAKSQKLDALKAHKKGLMQQLFPAEGETVPKLRFRQPDGKSFPKWDKVKLSALVKIVTRKNRSNLVSRVLTNSAVNGIMDQRDYFEKDIANKNNLDGYYTIEHGDYIYNPRTSTSAPVGPISKNKIGTGVMSPLYTIFRFKNIENDFYEQYFKTSHWHQYLRMFSNSGARHDRMSISINNFMEMPLPYPNSLEQQKIASCLSSLDELIALQRQKIEALKTHKKGLMQGLFPNPNETKP